MLFFLGGFSGTPGHNARYPIYLLIFTIAIRFTGCNNKYDMNMYIMDVNEI